MKCEALFLLHVLSDSAFQGTEILRFRFPKSFSSPCRSPAERDQCRALEAKARDRPHPGSLQAVGQEAQEEGTEEGRERGNVVPSSCFRSVALKLLGLRTTLHSESGDSKELLVMWVLSMKTEPY